MLGETISIFKLDALENFVVEAHADRSINGPASFIKANIIGVYVLLEV